MATHRCNAETSHRLAELLALLSGGDPWTTAEIQRQTGSMAVASDIADLRKAGIAIPPARYVGKSENGSKIYEYWLDRERPFIAPKEG